MHFLDRADAGRQLGQLLLGLREESPIVLGIPRGGVPVAFEVAAVLEAPLDVWVSRKVGAPNFAEFGLGAVAEGGVVYLDQRSVEAVEASQEEVDEIVRQKTAEVAERARRFRNGRPPPELEGRTVILVDDGIATGGTVRAALTALRAARPRKIVLAVPVAASQALWVLEPFADDIACLFQTPALGAIGAWYDRFDQVEDDQVTLLLELARGRGEAAGAPA